MFLPACCARCARSAVINFLHVTQRKEKFQGLSRQSDYPRKVYVNRNGQSSLSAECEAVIKSNLHV